MAQRIMRVFLSVSLLWMATFFGSSHAVASTSYESDECTSAGNAYCFSMHWESAGSETGGYSKSSCFVANKSIPNHYGYSPNGAVLVRYVFEYGQIDGIYNTCRLGNSGEGLGIKNNVASASNGECSVYYRIYYNSNYSGLFQTFHPTCGSYAPSDNMMAGMKNQNASHVRY